MLEAAGCFCDVLNWEELGRFILLMGQRPYNTSEQGVGDRGGEGAVLMVATEQEQGCRGWSSRPGPIANSCDLEQGNDILCACCLASCRAGGTTARGIGREWG